MSFTTSSSYTNQLLDNLSSESRVRFFADCEIVDLKFGKILAEPGKRISHALFPIECLVSLIASLNTRNQLEVFMAGNEGMVGVSLVLGEQISSLQAVVQGEGTALRMSSACFQRHLERNHELDNLMKRYINVLINQISQSATCAHFHELEARLARLLLMTHDRTRGDKLHLTHQFLSLMLGVRREGVTQAAKELQRRGLIDYQRGSITLQNRAGLEEASCGCYATDCEIYGKVFKQIS